MADQSGTHDIEALLEHAPWLRALARALLREGGSEGGAADDLVQDAFVAALARRAPFEGNPRSWLGGVLRNLARRRRRGEARRVLRERGREPADGEADAAAVLERADLQRRLFGHVFALEEPYRSTLLLRYFEGCAPEEVARRQGVPPSTARTRIARGLEQLRARLDREHGGERGAWCALLAPLAGNAAGAAPTLGSMGAEVLGMGIKAKAAAAAAVVAVAATAIILVRAEHGPQGAAEDDAAALPATAPPQEVADRPADGADPSAAAAPGPAARRAIATAAPELGVLVYGSLLGTGGERVAEGSLTLVDAVGRQTPASLGAPGSWSVLGLAPGAYQVVARCQGFVEATSALEVPAGVPEVRHDVRLDLALTVPVRFIDETGAPLRSLGAGWGRTLPVAVATLEPPPGALPGVDGRDASRCGVGTYQSRGEFGEVSVAGLAPQHDGLLRLRAPPPLWVSAVLSDQVLETRRLEGPVDELVFQVSPDRTRGLLGAVSVRVVDAESGEPLGGNVLFQEQMMPALGDPIGPDGRIEFLDRPPGVGKLLFRAPGYADARRHVRVLPGAVVDLGDVPLQRVARVSGRIVDERGQPVSTSFSLLAIDGGGLVQDVEPPWTSKSADDGSFEIECARTRIALVLTGSRWSCEPTIVDAGAVGSGGIELVARRGVEVNLRTGGMPWLGARVTLATGEGLAFRSQRVVSTLPIPFRLAPGRHELWAGWDERVLERVVFDVPAEPEGGALAVDVPRLENPR